MISRWDGDCSHFAPTRRPSDAYRGKPAGRWRRGAAKDQLVELLRLCLVELRHEMAVAIERRLNRGMTQLRLNVLRVGAVGDQEACISVAEVMEAHPAEASAPERLRELPVTEVVRIKGRASLATEDKLTASCG
jgi:hypothetical protein